jgi:ubiquinone biosynthesis protein
MVNMFGIRLFWRALQVIGLLWLHGAVFFCRWLAHRMRRASQQDRLALLGESLLHLLRSLGATYIKVGQFLSTRGDLVPLPVLSALQKLQDRVGPFPYAQVRRTLEAELGEPPERIFVELDPYPVASASVSQVHRGLLRDGRVVAVKVLRPDIERTVRLDLAVLRLCARGLAVVPRFRPFQPVAVVEEFSRAVGLQVDLQIEAANNRIFAANFAHGDSVKVPLLVPDLCTARVLCMEYVPGVKILSRAWDPGRGEDLARLGFRALLQMIFVDGFVHADLHPGNLMVHEGRLYLLDLGLVARLTSQHRQILARLFAAWARKDAAQVAEVVLELAPSGGSSVDLDRLRQELAGLMIRYGTLALAEVQLGAVLLDVARLLPRHGVRLEPALTMIIIAIGVVEGLGRALAPHLDLVREALSFLSTQHEREIPVRA